MANESEPDADAFKRSVTEIDALSAEGRRYRTLTVSKSGDADEDDA